MGLIVSLDTFYKPKEPIITLPNGEIDERCHPILLAAIDFAAKKGYGYLGQTSGSQQYTIISEANFISTSPKTTKYTDMQYAKEGFLNCQTIYEIPFEDLEKCKIIGSAPKNLRWDATAKHIFGGDNNIIPPCTHLPKLLELLKYSISHFRFGDIYKGLQSKLLTTPEGKYAIEVQQQRVKNGNYSVEKNIFYNQETGSIEIKKQYTRDYQKNKDELMRARDYITNIKTEQTFQNAVNNYYNDAISNDTEQEKSVGRGRGAA